ncbi:MAG: DNA-processing protein DprA [Ignavibacteria bacterium]|nr:DNA-processing protein DprA [Ignavibacteria bacterium]MBT8383586.1 DNA-processing protein DprA [Ignavibacteria bacterium]MBT8390672.1 DNA-processing protein DprA [Ignavibacteria bacterium]NNJ51728.1 DNA-protecting protein DprA [Ignavibacteriaceae bacterium]NNL20719.1 DNA-protecting protein DprA [Ignavibacteriaceae bacterium]
MSKLSFDQLADLFLLLSVEGIGPGKIRNLLAKFRSTQNILSADAHSLMEADRISINLAKRIRKTVQQRKEIEKFTENELNRLEKIGGKLVTIWDKDYPPLLKKIYDPPLLFYLLGNLSESDQYSIAVVGTRGPTNYGKIQTERIAGELASQGITIVSGMARGIDSIAHWSAIKNGGKTIAVVGSGLDVIYPPENKKLFETITENGAVISEFVLGTSPDAQNFPKRNRIISGLSLGVIVIQSGINGGAMQTAAFALDQNREVFALPGDVGVKQADGTNLLIQKSEAELIRSAEDVILELELKLKPVLGKNIPKQQIDLSLFEEKILNVLNSEPLQIDKIAMLAKVSTSDCLVNLLSLEFKGLVKQLPGKMFALL